MFRQRHISQYLNAKNVQRVFTALVLITVLVIVSVFALNYTKLQKPLNRIIDQDARNNGVHATVYFDSFIDTKIIVFDVRAIGPPAGPAGVFRAFFQFARELQGRKIEEVVLAFRGKPKLKLNGDDFLALGASFGTMQPKKLLWELARNLRLPNGKLVISHVPGNYAAMLQKNLGEVSESQAASDLLKNITQ